MPVVEYRGKRCKAVVFNSFNFLNYFNYQKNYSSSLTGNSMRYALMKPSILPSITPSTSVV